MVRSSMIRWRTCGGVAREFVTGRLESGSSASMPSLSYRVTRVCTHRHETP